METLVEEHRNTCLLIRLNRPDRKNAINLRMMEELVEAFQGADRDPRVRALILTGGTDVFCVGADLKSRMEEQGTEITPEGDRLIMAMKRGMSVIESVGKPVIAAISGYALGGGLELALACDFRYASENAKLGLPETKVGTMPGGGGTQRLSRLIGQALAKELMFTGNMVDAAEALRIGLVNKVFPVSELLARTIDVAQAIGKRAPLSIRMIKAAVNTGTEMPLHASLSYETACHSLLSQTEDREEGIKAFLEKREPVFQGR